jgi:hypothetical protein
VPILTNLAYPAFPLKAQVDDRLAEKARAWIDENAHLRQRYPLFSASLPHLFMQLDLDRLDSQRVADSSRAVATNPPRGVIMLWDNIYSTHNSNGAYCVSHQQLDQNGWIQARRFDDEDRTLVIYLSPLDANGDRSR